MEAKHTPGPWTYYRHEESYGTSFYISQQEGAPYTPNYSDVAHWYCSTCSGEYLAIQEANARLIAAAPELLEALQAAFDFPADVFDTPEGESFTMTVTGWHLQKIRAAIAKATGEQA